MRTGSLLRGCFALLAAAALAAPAAGSAAPDRGAGAEGEGHGPWLGVMVDGGFPDGIAGSIVLRPLAQLRLDAGLGYNLIGYGFRGGLTVVPFRFPLAPLLRVSGGHELGADASGLASRFARLSALEKSLLRSVSYDHVEALVGVELGAPDRFLFFLRAGLGWFWTHATGFEAAVRAANPSLDFRGPDPSVRGTYPSASAGFVLFLG